MPYHCPKHNCDGTTRVPMTMFNKDRAIRQHICKKCGFSFSTTEQPDGHIPAAPRMTYRQEEKKFLEEEDLRRMNALLPGDSLQPVTDPEYTWDRAEDTGTLLNRRNSK